MPEYICDTSVMQYLHQIGVLHILPALGSSNCIPPAVSSELAAGRQSGIDLPDVAVLDWLTVVVPAARP